MTKAHFFASNRVFTYPKVESTNGLALQKIKDQQARHGDILIAEYQTAGKGQQANTWYSSEGSNILCSIICKDIQLPVQNLSSVNMLVSLAVHKVINHYFNGMVSVKWPNDVLVGNQKIAGILIESALSGSHVKHLVIGLGINVNEPSFPAELKSACSFFTLTQSKTNKEELLNELIVTLNDFLTLSTKLGIQEIIKRYELVQYGINQKKYFRIDNEQIEGIILGVNSEGQLRVETQAGILTFNTKQISLDLTGH